MRVRPCRYVFICVHSARQAGVCMHVHVCARARVWPCLHLVLCVPVLNARIDGSSHVLSCHVGGPRVPAPISLGRAFLSLSDL